MNKKLIISTGLVLALTTSIAAYADTTIYTDGLGRMHFLGRDAANNVKSTSNYANSQHQDLTRKLYEKSAEGVVEDTSYDQHPLKNYENTFPDTRFTNTKYWRTKGADDGTEYGNTTKSSVTATKGATDYSGQYAYGSTFLDNPNAEKNVIKTTEKKHWWNRKKK